MPLVSLLPELRQIAVGESARIQREFEESGDGRRVLARRTALVDTLVTRLFRGAFPEQEKAERGFCVAATGGYGRRVLFPHSDVDLLFLCEDAAGEERRRAAIAAICQALWDLGLRVAPATRTLGECDRFRPDNAEFTIALLDCRYLAGDAELFARLRVEAIPRLVSRERHELTRALAGLTRNRHARHGNTIFHLEPNLKESPGGLRDYDVARWLEIIARPGEHRGRPAPDALAPVEAGEGCEEAFEFLAATRCFLHYARGRDENGLTYELQEAVARAGIGAGPAQAIPATDWMRLYFRHARVIYRRALQLLEEGPAARSSLYRMWESWRSRLSNQDFSVVRGRIFLRRPEMLGEPAVLLRLFAFLARHELALSADTERRLAGLARTSPPAMPGAAFWAGLREILLLPGAADALRAMHRAGLLVKLAPEFKAIDALVIRDFYHRYTVDEHSFMAVENLHRLRRPGAEGDPRYRGILSELDQPELLYLALLLHDVGKGLPVDDHVQGSLQTAEAVLERFALAPVERETVLFLIASHLEMSATLQRRDIFDPFAIRSLARKVETPERLRMLCLLTYTDIRSVNPEALTAWKADMLWQLYVSTANYLNRKVDDERFHSAGTPAELTKVARAVGGGATAEAVAAFLEGFPRRYLASHSPGQIAAHYRMALDLGREPVRIELARVSTHYVLTLLTRDRPMLFSTIAGALFAWGMSITKAEAFASHAGIVVDTFHFVDLHRTLELNPSEVERFRQNLASILAGRADLERLLAGKSGEPFRRTPKVQVPTRLRFDDDCSAHSTVVEIIAKDRPGLLYHMSRAIAETGGNIEVALIDTEGPKAIDVFYLTAAGRKLDPDRQRLLEKALREQLDGFPG
jgi:[protein-PII] uridylyltransferase